jgi:hypothetical protein
MFMTDKRHISVKIILAEVHAVTGPRFAVTEPYVFDRTDTFSPEVKRMHHHC